MRPNDFHHTQVCFNQVHLGKGGPHKTRQTCPEVEDIPVLITVETHSVIETGEVTCGTGTGTDLLSKVSNRGRIWFIDDSDTCLQGGNSILFRQVGRIRAFVKKSSERDDSLVLWTDV